MRLLLWAIFKEPKRLAGYLNILRGTAYAGRLERLDNMLVMFAQQEVRWIGEHD